MKKATEEAGRMKLELAHADQRREKAESAGNDLSHRLQLVNDELTTQRARPVFQGNEQGELTQLTQTCQAKENKIQIMEIEVIKLKKSLTKAESDSFQKEELERTIRSMTTSSQEQDWKLEDAEKKSRLLESELEEQRLQGASRRTDDTERRLAQEVAKMKAPMANSDSEVSSLKQSEAVAAESERRARAENGELLAEMTGLKDKQVSTNAKYKQAVILADFKAFRGGLFRFP